MPQQLGERLGGSRGVDEVPEAFLSCPPSALGGHSKVKFATLHTVACNSSFSADLLCTNGEPVVSRLGGQLSEGSRGRTSLLSSAFEMSS